jgi:hypothetical protein
MQNFGGEFRGKRSFKRSAWIWENDFKRVLNNKYFGNVDWIELNRKWL